MNKKHTTRIITALGLAVTAAMPVLADAGDVFVRLRALYVSPDESANTSIGGDVSVSDELIPELDISYFVTDKIALELVLATARHNTAAINTDLGDLELGDIWLLPPTLLVQYHPLAGQKFSPYVGAGVNYTFFYNQSPPLSGPVTQVNHENGFGFALQAGADFYIDDNWFINVDVKRLFLNTDVEINGGAITADVDLDPWLFGIGFGRSF